MVNHVVVTWQSYVSHVLCHVLCEILEAGEEGDAGDDGSGDADGQAAVHVPGGQGDLAQVDGLSRFEGQGPDDVGHHVALVERLDGVDGEHHDPAEDARQCAGRRYAHGAHGDGRVRNVPVGISQGLDDDLGGLVGAKIDC